MDLTVDAESPVPPSHQIAEGLRYRIAVGDLRPGDGLPSLRDAASALGVHYLTVRKAYQALRGDGLVESERGVGTWVAAGTGRDSSDRALRRFLTDVLRSGWREHALRPAELVALLQRQAAEPGVPAGDGGDGTAADDPHASGAGDGRASDADDPRAPDADDPRAPDADDPHASDADDAHASDADDALAARTPAPRPAVQTAVAAPSPAAPAGGPRPVHVVECSRLQAEDYASQLREHLERPVEPWLLDGGEPPPGTIVGTYFHFNDIRDFWPHRAADLVFVTVRLDPGLAEELEADAREAEKAARNAKNAGPERAQPGAEVQEPATVRLCEVDEVRIHSVLPDLNALLPDRVRVEQLPVADPGRALATDDPAPVLFAPRLWARLSDGERADARARLLRYVIDPTSLERLP